MKFLVAILPSAGVVFLFWLAIRAIFQADRRERAAEAALRKAERERVGDGTGHDEAGVEGG